MSDSEAKEEIPVEEQVALELDEEELLKLEDELFDLEDELISMQGTTIRSNEQEEDDEEDEILDVYTYNKPVVDEDKEEKDEKKEATLEEQIEEFAEQMADLKEAKPGQLLAADLRENDEPQFEAGQYVLESDGGRRLFAGRPGQVVWFGDTVNVLPIYHVDGDVDADTGDIRYDGNVFIEGMIQDNRLVEARGNIWVMGGIGRANIKASGDVVVRGGIKGSEKQRIEAHGNVFARFAENARIKTGQNVIINEVAMHSKIEASKGLYLTADNGNIIGGELNVGEIISCQNLGSSTYPETIVRMGARGVLQQELEQLENRRDSLARDEEKFSKNVNNLKEKKEEEDGLSPRDEERLRTLQFELTHTREDLQQIKHRIEEIQEELDTTVKREVLVRGTVYPGVDLHIGTIREPVEEERQHCAISVDGAEIKYDSYHEPAQELDFAAELGIDIEKMEAKHSMPGLDEIRKNMIFQETKPLFNRQEQLKRLLGLEDEEDLVLLEQKMKEGEDEAQKKTKPEEEPEEEEETPGGGFRPTTWWVITVRAGENKKSVERYFDENKTDSVKVRCKNPKKGLQRAAEHFGLPEEELAVKILEEGQPGFWGFGKKDYLIRVIKKDVLEEQKAKESGKKTESFDLLAEAAEESDVAGFINLDNSMEGLKLTVYPPQGHGLPVTLEQIRSELKESNYTQNIDWVKIEEMIEKQDGETEIIGPRQRDPNIDGSFSVTLNESQTEAYLSVIPPKPEGVAVTLDEVIEYLEKEGLDYEREEVERVFEEELFEEDILIASGRLPEHGKDAELDFKVDIEEKEDEEESEEKVDFHAGQDVISVKEDEVLVEIIPATEGEPGITVYGEEIPPEPGEDVGIKAGENTRMSPDGLRLIAEKEGRVRYKDGEVWVEPVLIIEGDLDYEVGNIRFEGVVIVKGMILDGFKVLASQRVEADSVGKAHVKSGGDVVLAKGFVGRGEGVIEAKGNVFAKYLENCKVKAGGSIIVEQSIMHSDVDAEEYIILEGKRRASIVGGLARAGKAISANKIGAKMAAKTEVEVGISPKIRDRVQEIENEIQGQKEKLDKIRIGLKGLLEQASKLGGVENLAEDKQEQRKELAVRARAVKKKMENLQSELKELRNEIQGSEGGEIIVNGELVSGVKITVQTATLYLTDSESNVRYKLIDGELKKDVYKPLEVDIERPET
ncbi:MAG: FapA family protein [bacterium]